MTNWRPSADLGCLRRRAATLAHIRAYFLRTGAIEVTTPILSKYATSEPTLENLTVAGAGRRGYLRTSPESALKCLLAAGSGDIYEIGPAFRAHESGPLHLTEFTLLEWYRLGHDHHRLMDDVAALIAGTGYAAIPRRITYAELFRQTLGPEPHALANAELCELASDLGLALDGFERTDRAFMLDALFACRLGPRLASMGTIFLYDFPAELRAYAKLTSASPPLAQRFELIIDGVEIANGYHELTDADEQQGCFELENERRVARGLPAVELDADWLAALREGLPAASGVALGIERLLFVMEHAAALTEVTAFAD